MGKRQDGNVNREPDKSLENSGRASNRKMSCGKKTAKSHEKTDPERQGETKKKNRT